MKAPPSPCLLQRLHKLCATVLGLLFALTSIGCSLTRNAAVVAEGFNRPEWRPVDASASAAEHMGREALETLGYDGLLRMIRDVGWSTTKPQASLPPDIRAGLARDEASPGIEVFTREAHAAGVTTLIDAPVPRRTNVRGLGIVVIGLFHAHYLAVVEVQDGPDGKLMCPEGHPDLMALPCLYIPPPPPSLPATTQVPTPTVTAPPSAVSVPTTCGTTDPTSKGHPSTGGEGLRRATSADPPGRVKRSNGVGYPEFTPARSNDPSGPCPQPFIPAPASAQKIPERPPPQGKDYKAQHANEEARQAKEKADRLGYEQGHRVGETVGKGEQGLKTLESSIGVERFKLALHTNPKFVEKLQAGLAAKLNAIAALPADVDPKLAQPGFDRGFRAGLGDAKVEATAVNLLANGALALSGDLALLLEQAGITVLRAALARFKTIPVFLPAAVGGGGGFVRLSKPVAAAEEGAAAAKAAQAEGAEGAARGGAKAPEFKVPKPGTQSQSSGGNAAGERSKIPNNELKAPPAKRGNAPTGSDGHPVELHHRDQTPNSPLDEMTRTEHRGARNFSKNHSNTGQQPSQINRDAWKQAQKGYWQKEWDSGRFNNK